MGLANYVHGNVWGEYNLTLRPTATHFCWLTKASGDYDGDNGASAGIYVLPQSGGYWHLVSESGSSSYGEAKCVPRSCFRGDGANDVVWVSGQFGALANSGASSCDYNETAAWWGDAATVLQSWPGPGRTEGGGEYVRSILSGSPWNSSAVAANDCQFNDPYPWIQATGTSLFVGTPSGGKACHYTGVPFLVSGTVTLDLGVPIDQAVCFFTKIRGKFRGGGEAVSLYHQNSRWYASSQSQQGSSVGAEGRCYYFHQWDL